MKDLSMHTNVDSILPKSQKEIKVYRHDGEKCPECGSRIEKTGRCSTCRTCGYSLCEGS